MSPSDATIPTNRNQALFVISDLLRDRLFSLKDSCEEEDIDENGEAHLSPWSEGHNWALRNEREFIRNLLETINNSPLS